MDVRAYKSLLNAKIGRYGELSRLLVSRLIDAEKEAKKTRHRRWVSAVESLRGANKLLQLAIYELKSLVEELN
jgi:hypothetical protein